VSMSTKENTTSGRFLMLFVKLMRGSKMIACHCEYKKGKRKISLYILLAFCPIRFLCEHYVIRVTGSALGSDLDEKTQFKDNRDMSL
jgi:hypothetical protein